jgi:hypothetical protein
MHIRPSLSSTYPWAILTVDLSRCRIRCLPNFDRGHQQFFSNLSVPVSVGDIELDNSTDGSPIELDRLARHPQMKETLPLTVSKATLSNVPHDHWPFSFRLSSTLPSTALQVCESHFGNSSATMDVSPFERPGRPMQNYYIGGQDVEISGHP